MSENNIKLYWDFRGPDASRTAAHHKVHLDEFIAKHQITGAEIELENVDSNYSVVIFWTVESHVPFLRKSLKPHRGTRVNQKP